MSITNKINEIIDRRIGRNGFEGNGHFEAVRQKRMLFEELMQTLHDYEVLRGNVLSQNEAKQGEYYVMSTEDPTMLQKVELADPSATILQLQKCLAEAGIAAL